MLQVIAIGYRDEASAALARGRGRLDACGPDAAAVVVRGDGGRFDASTSFSISADGLPWGLFWAALISGAVLDGRLLVDDELVAQLQELLRQSTSVLLLAVDAGDADEAIELLSPLGGTVLTGTIASEDLVRRPVR